MGLVMKARHVTEDPIFKWEFNQETRLKYEDWWQWQLRDMYINNF